MSIKGAGSFNGGAVAIPEMINPFKNLSNLLLAEQKQATDEAYKNEVLGMQKAEHQMKVDAVAQAAKEKEAANRYADVLGAATSGNVIGVPDQKILGEQVAAMGEKAQAAYASGNKGLGDEIVAQQESYVNSVLPKMTKAYKANPEAQLQVLRGTNPLGGTADLAPQTRLALLKEAEAPIEKKADRIQALADQKALLAEQAKMQEAADTRREARDDKKWKAMQDIAEAKENRVLEKTTNASLQKKVDQATGKAEAINTMLNTMDQTNPDVKANVLRYKTIMSDINSKKARGLPIETALESLDAFEKELSKTEDRQYTKAQKDQEKKTKFLTSASDAADDGLELDALVDSATDGLLGADAQILEDKYRKDSRALLSDLYDKNPDKREELLQIMSSSMPSDAFWGPNKEDRLQRMLEDPKVQGSILGKPVRKLGGLGN